MIKYNTRCYSVKYKGNMMKKKALLLSIMVVIVSLTFTGCFGFDGLGGSQPTQTMPPHTDFTSVEDFTSAVAKAKAGNLADDVTNLAGLTAFYTLNTLPEGAKVSYVKVSADIVRVGYSFGPTAGESFDNQMELAWYRNADPNKFLTDSVQSMVTYDSIKSDYTEYIHTIPTFQFMVTAEPGVTAEAEPTPRSQTYCQFLYWIKDSKSFMCAVPLGFSNDDIIKYCVAEMVELK